MEYYLSYNCGLKINLNNSSVSFVNISNELSLSEENYYYFNIVGDVVVSGNIQSLLNYSNNVYNYCFYKLFSDCKTLTNAPILPITELASNCYAYMFSGCISLIKPPELPATTLVDYCYKGMFEGCVLLDNIKAYFGQWHENATENWLKGVSSNGSFNMLNPDL